MSFLQMPIPKLMDVKINTFKQQIQPGKRSFGIWNGLPGPYTAEICAGAGFDWVCIDGEHAPFDLNDLLQNLQSVELHAATPIIRIPSADPTIIKQLTDMGAQNILIPMIESVQQAETVAKAMRYPPHGSRGVGMALARAAQWDRVNNYHEKADAQMCCIGQVESVKGVAVLDDLLQVEGLDVVFIGPADLAATMGYLGQAGHPEVVALVVDCIRRIRKAGKAAGFLTTSKKLIDAYTEAGSQMIGVGLDALLLAQATSALAAEYKPPLDQ